MSAPLVVNTRDGACWTRRTVTEGGIALYALADVCKCPEFVMATLAELAERGIVGSADVLPVPVGPQMPDFPPPPETFEEKLRQDVARLQGLLAEAVRDVHRARSERDLIRERVSEPFGCARCGVEKRSHGRRYIGGAGMHAWERPSDVQVKARMLARRVARSPLPAAPELERLRSSLREACDQIASLESDLGGATARIAELEAELLTANETLSDVAEARRADRDRIAGLEAGPALPWAHVMGDGDLSMFLDDMVSAAMGRWRSEPEVPDRTVLADIEKVCADWRTPGEGLRGDPEPEAVPDAVRQAYMPVASLREDPHDSPLYHPYRPGLGRDLPETGGTR